MQHSSSKVPGVIEWEHLDKRKYFFFGPALNLGTNALLYPAKLIRVRLQAQQGNSVYSGAIDAFKKIKAREGGPRALFKGFSVNCFGVFASQVYITTFEWSRAASRPYFDSEIVRNLGAGVAAALASQCITVPVDVVSQRLMVHGQNLAKAESGTLSARTVASRIVRAESIWGFFKGYTASLLTIVPTSGLIWALYGKFRALQLHAGSDDVSQSLGRNALNQALASAAASGCTAMFTNPLEVVKTQIQVNAKLGEPVSIRGTLKELVLTEGLRALTKGLTARVVHMTLNTTILMVAYESVKLLSLHS
eukprot:m.194981 g.194981  ORF g.194981 m.194981 type:complete len:307 (+) comp18673_c0_seq1:316-1236(+)